MPSTRHRPGEAYRWVVLALLVLAGAAYGYKKYQQDRLAALWQAEAEQPELRMAEPTEAPKDIVGIVADPGAGEDKMRIHAKRTDMPDLQASMQALGVAKEVLPVLQEFGGEKVVQEFKEEFKADPELNGAIAQFQKDKDIYGLIKQLHNNAAFQNMLRKYGGDARFQHLMKIIKDNPQLVNKGLGTLQVSSGTASAVQGAVQATMPIVPPSPGATAAPEEPEPGDAGEAEEPGPTIDPNKVSGSGPARRETPVPPPPNKR